jgi:hypothetical protein
MAVFDRNIPERNSEFREISQQRHFNFTDRDGCSKVSIGTINKTVDNAVAEKPKRCCNSRRKNKYCGKEVDEKSFQISVVFLSADKIKRIKP